MGHGIFISYRRDDAGWVATALADALRRHVGPDRVFLDTGSIVLGDRFAATIEAAVRDSTVLVALIGPRYDTGRLDDPRDWVRRELLLARDLGVRILPVLIDRTQLPSDLPPALRFLAELHHEGIRAHHPEDIDAIVAAVAASAATGPAAPSQVGVPATRAELDAFLRDHLPPSQQWSRNRDRLLDLALTVLGREDRLVLLAPCRVHDGPRGSATVLLTATDVVVVEVDENFRIVDELRFPRALVRRIEVVPTLAHVDTVLSMTAGDEVALRGMFRDQARQLADHLRA